jgi:hypothetical protein
MECVALFRRLETEAKALVADRWFAISSLAQVLTEKGEIGVRTHLAGRAN